MLMKAILSSDHQEEDLALKSLITKVRYSFFDLYLEAFSQNLAKIG